MTADRIYEQVRAILLDDFEIAADRISIDANMREAIGLDSLDFVDIVVSIEREFGFKPTTQDLKRMETLRDLCEYIGMHTVR